MVDIFLISVINGILVSEADGHFKIPCRHACVEDFFLLENSSSMIPGSFDFCLLLYISRLVSFVCSYLSSPLKLDKYELMHILYYNLFLIYILLLGDVTHSYGLIAVYNGDGLIHIHLEEMYRLSSVCQISSIL